MVANRPTLINANENFAPEAFTTLNFEFGARELLAA